MRVAGEVVAATARCTRVATFTEFKLEQLATFTEITRGLRKNSSKQVDDD